MVEAKKSTETATAPSNASQAPVTEIYLLKQTTQ
jgi:hypothetical protein